MKKLKTIKHKPGFSRIQLVASCIIFGAVGAYVILHIFAASPTPNQSPNFMSEPESQKTFLLKRQVVQESQEISVLARASKGHPSNPAKENAHIVDVSKKRLNDIKDLLQKDPQAVSDVLVSSDVATTAGTIPGVALEKKVELKGRFMQYHNHSFDNQGNITGEDNDFNKLTVFGANWKDTKQYNLFNADPNAFDLAPDTSLDVQGVAFDDFILAQTVKKISPVSTDGKATTIGFVGRTLHSIGSLFGLRHAEALSTGTVKTAVIAIQMVDSPQPYNMTNLRNNWTTNPNHNVVDFFNKMSYGKLNVSPDFYGPYTLPSTFSNANKNCFALSSQLFQAAFDAANADVNYQNYTRFFFAINCTSADGLSSGGGQTGVGDGAVSTPDGVVQNAQVVSINDSYGLLHSTTHEMGHSFGSYHAGYDNCTPDDFEAPTRFDQGCTTVAYGDLFSVMGNGSNGGGYQLTGDADFSSSFTAPEKSRIGWLAPNNISTLSTPGTYTQTIAPLENSSSGIQAIHIPRGGSGTDFWLEYRQPIGYDSWFTDAKYCPGCNITNGPTLRLGTSTYFPSSGGGNDSLLIDATPYSNSVSDVNDSAILPGHSFSDPLYGIKITTNSADATGTNVTVSLSPAASCVRNAPGVNVANATQTVSPGQTASFDVTVTNNDTATCTDNKFRTGDIGGNTYSQSILSTDYRAAATPNIFSLAPGASKVIKLAVTQPLNYFDNNPNSYMTNFNVCGNFTDAACSNYSVTLNQTTPADTTPPSVPGGLSASSLGSRVIRLNWQAASDNIKVIGYNIYRNGALIDTVRGTTSYVDWNTSVSTSYSYQIEAFDYKNNKSGLSNSASTSTAATTDYTAPTINDLRFSVNDAHSITVNWDPATDNVGVAFYWVMIGSRDVKLPATATSYTFDGLAASTAYTIYNNPVDGAGNVGYSNSQNNVVYTPAEGTIPPSRPGLTTNQNIGLTPTRHDILFTPSTDDKAVIGYKYFSSGRPLGTVKYPAIANTHFSNGSNTEYVQALDADGNITQSMVAIDPLGIPNGTLATDTTPPTAQVNSPAAGTTVSGTSNAVSISSNDNVGVSGVELYVDNTLVNAMADRNGVNSSATPSFSTSLTWDTTMFANGSHILSAKAYDGQGNNVGTSSPVSVTVSNATSADTTPPTASISSPANGSSVSGSVAVASSASDNVGVARVDLLVDGVLVSSDSTSPYSFGWDSTKLANGGHTISVNAYDAANNSSSSQISVTLNNGDTTPPSTPTGLSATASAYNRVNLSWSPSTDNVGVAGYYIVRGGVTIAQTSGTSYSDTTVNANTTYIYQVIAYDAQGNSSGLSNVASTVTPAVPDTTAPTAPASLSATAVSSSQINLAWGASTDNIGVTSYDIYRNSSKLASLGSNSTSYGDSRLSASTSYSYYVIARDAAGNTSPASNTASATTQTPPPPTTTGSISGTIYSSKGGVVAGATVQISYSGSRHSYSSNSSGIYSVASLPAGTYNPVKYSARGFNGLSLSLSVVGGQTTTQNVTLVSRK